MIVQLNANNLNEALMYLLLGAIVAQWVVVPVLAGLYRYFLTRA